MTMKDLMDEYFRLNRKALSEGNYAAAQVFSVAEDLTDSFHKSQGHAGYIAALIVALESNSMSAEGEEELDAYLEAIRTAKNLD